MKSFSPIEKEMANVNLEELTAKSEAAKANIASATSIGDIKTEICNVWSSVGKYIKLLEPVPIIGKFVTILADLLDSICPAG